MANRPKRPMSSARGAEEEAPRISARARVQETSKAQPMKSACEAKTPGNPRPRSTSYAMAKTLRRTSRGRSSARASPKQSACSVIGCTRLQRCSHGVRTKNCTLWRKISARTGSGTTIVQHPDSSILDGGNRLRACEINGCKPRITRWDGKPGEELTFVISQNVKRRHLNESQRALIANKLAALPSGQRQDGKF